MNKKSILGSIFAVATILVVTLCGILIFSNDTNIINQVTTKEKATKLLNEVDTSRSYITKLENSTVNYTEDASYLLSGDNKYYYGQGFYLTDNKTGEVQLSYSIDENDFDDIENKNKEISETLSKEDNEKIDKITSLVNDFINKDNNYLYAIIGQLMVWTVTEEVNIEFLSDILSEIYININKDIITADDTASNEKSKTSKTSNKKETSEVEIETNSINSNVTPAGGTKPSTENVENVEKTNNDSTPNSSGSTSGNDEVTNQVKSRFATNTASVCAGSCKESVVNIPLKDDTPVTSFNITKTAVTESGSTTEVKPGEKITYRVSVNNTGETILSNIWISDVPNNIKDFDLTTLSSITSKTGHIFMPSALGTVICISPIDPGETASFEFSVNASSTASGSIINNVNATDGSFYADGQNVLTVVEPVATEEISIIKNALTESGSTTEVKPGEKIYYEIIVENTGDIAIVNDLMISDTPLSSSSPDFDMSTLSSVSATINGVPTGSLLQIGTGLWFYNATFNPGDTLVLKFSINASNTVTSELINTVDVTGGSVTDEDDNTLIVNGTTDPVTDLTINKVVTDTNEPIDDLASINETLKYTVSVTNNGDDVNNVIIEDLMDDMDLNPSTAKLVEVNDGTSIIDPTNYSVTSNNLTLNSIPSGATYNIVYTVDANYKFDTSDTVDNTATIVSIDSVATSDISSTATINKQSDDIALTDLEFGKFVRDTEASRLDSYPKNDYIDQEDVKVAPLETVYWDLVISNPTDKVGTNIKIKDTPPDGFYNFLTITATKNGVATWDGWSTADNGSEKIITIDSIAPGDTWVFTLESKFATEMYKDSYENYFQTTNTATLYDATDTQIGSASASIYLENLVDIQIFQINGETVSPGDLDAQSVRPGDKLKFELKVLNPTIDRMNEGDVHVEVPLPENLIKKGSCNITSDGGNTFTNNSKCEGEGFIGIGGSAQDTVTFKPNNIDPGEDPEGDARMSFEVRLADDITEQLFELTAYFKWTEPGSARLYTDQDFATVTTYNAPNIDVRVTTPSTSISEDEWVPFKITVQNTGAVELAGSLSVTDTKDNYLSKYVRNVTVTPLGGTTAIDGFVEDYDPFSITAPKIFMLPGDSFTIDYEQKADYSFNGKLDSTYNTVKTCINTTAGSNYCEIGLTPWKLVTNPTKSINDSAAIIETNSIQSFRSNKKK